MQPEEITDEITFSITSFSALPEIAIHDTWERLLTHFEAHPEDIFKRLNEKRQYYLSVTTDQLITMDLIKPERPFYSVLKGMSVISLINLRIVEIQLVHLHLLANTAMIVGTYDELLLTAKVMFKLAVLLHVELFNIRKRKKDYIPYPKEPVRLANQKDTAIYVMTTLNEIVVVLRSTEVLAETENRKNINFNQDFLKTTKLLIKLLNTCVTTA